MNVKKVAPAAAVVAANKKSLFAIW